MSPLFRVGSTSTVTSVVGSPATTMLPDAHESMLISTGSEYGKSQLVMTEPFYGAGGVQTGGVRSGLAPRETGAALPDARPAALACPDRCPPLCPPPSLTL